MNYYYFFFYRRYLVKSSWSTRAWGSHCPVKTGYLRRRLRLYFAASFVFHCQIALVGYWLYFLRSHYFAAQKRRYSHHIARNCSVCPCQWFLQCQRLHYSLSIADASYVQRRNRRSYWACSVELYCAPCRDCWQALCCGRERHPTHVFNGFFACWYAGGNLVLLPRWAHQETSSIVLANRCGKGWLQVLPTEDILLKVLLLAAEMELQLLFFTLFHAHCCVHRSAWRRCGPLVLWSRQCGHWIKISPLRVMELIRRQLHTVLFSD